jgi:hypothetical protein
VQRERAGFIFLVHPSDVGDVLLLLACCVTSLNPSSSHSCSENVVFIFLVHPFDVGDTLLLSTTSGGAARHDVEEIHLNYTRFLDKDNGRVWWPNRVLRDTPFINLSMSGAYSCTALILIIISFLKCVHCRIAARRALHQPLSLRYV